MSLAIEMNLNYKHTQNSLLSVIRSKDRHDIKFLLEASCTDFKIWIEIRQEETKP